MRGPVPQKYSRGGRTTRPRAISELRQSVKIDHRGCDASWVLPKVVDDVLSNGRPRSDASSSLPQTGVADDPSAHGLIAYIGQIIAKNLVYEALFGLALNVNK